MQKTVFSVMMVLLVMSTLALALKVQPVRAADWAGTIEINADGSIGATIPEGTRYIHTIDNITYFFTEDIIYYCIAVFRNNITIDGNGHTLQGSGKGTGIYLCGNGQGDELTGVTVQNVQIKDFDDGFWLDYASKNTISGNNITNNTYWGIASAQSSSNTISGNNIAANGGFGIYLDYSSDHNTISGNNVTNDGTGIGIEHSSSNTITGNNIAANNAYYGIFLAFSSDYNTISRNNITNNDYGFRPYSSSGNTIYHNNFIGNSVHVYSDGGSVNNWDNGYPSGGNYWSGYTGVDLKRGPNQDQPGSDGIGDTPYVIDSNNTDHYPLMKTWVQRSATSVTCSPTPVSAGSPVTCTAMVSGTNPTGTITWSANSITGSFSQSVCALSSGTCSTTYTDTTAGTVTITASYSGDTNNAPSTGSTTLTAENVAIVSISPTSVVMDFGQSQDFTSSVAGGVAPYTYQWYLDGAPVPSATSQYWTFAPIGSSHEIHSVYVKVTDAANAVSTSSTVQVNVYHQPSVTISPTSATSKVGDSQLFTSVTLDGAWPFTFQWYLNDNTVLGATDGTLTFTPTSVGSYTIKLQATDSAGVTATSDTANVQVMYAVTFTESGLAQGTEWSVTLDTETKSATSDSIVFYRLNGQYNFRTNGAGLGYTLQLPTVGQLFGTIVVSGKDVVWEPIGFIPAQIQTAWNDAEDSYSIGNPGPVWSPSGVCYGISSTALMYFMHYTLNDATFPCFPVQGPLGQHTSDLEWPSEKGVLTNVSLAVIFQQLYQINSIGLVPSPAALNDENEQYKNLIGNLSAGYPVVLILGTPSGWTHAVVAFGICPQMRQDPTGGKHPTGNTEIYLYDPVYANGTTRVAVYDIATGSFSYHNILNDLPVGGVPTFNLFYVINPSDMLPSTARNPLSTLFPKQEWWRNCLIESLQGYKMVVARVKVTIENVAGGNTFEDYFNGEGLGDSQKFICGIKGSSGIVEGGLQVYAIPNSVGAFSVEEVSSSGVSAISVGAVTSAGSVSVDQTPLTGANVEVTGSSAPDGTPVTITTTKLTETPTSTVQISTTPASYYDVSVEGVSDGTATVCITNSGVTDQTTLQYWDGTQWKTASDLTVSGNIVCGKIPVSALTGTPIAIGPLSEPMRHDVAVVDVSPYRNWVYENLLLNVSVTVVNLGDFNETAIVGLYYNITAGSKIGTEAVSLSPNETETLTFTWNTTGIQPGLNYTVTANAIISFDSDMTNNVLDSTIKVKVRILGDVNGDGIVNIRDVMEAVHAFNSFPGTPRWNPYADIDGSGRVDMRDIVIILLNFNKHE